MGAAFHCAPSIVIGAAQENSKLRPAHVLVYNKITHVFVEDKNVFFRVFFVFAVYANMPDFFTFLFMFRIYVIRGTPY